MGGGGGQPLLTANMNTGIDEQLKDVTSRKKNAVDGNHSGGFIYLGSGLALLLWSRWATEKERQ